MLQAEGRLAMSTGYYRTAALALGIAARVCGQPLPLLRE
jgi:hypothetical protein